MFVDEGFEFGLHAEAQWKEVKYSRVCLLKLVWMAFGDGGVSEVLGAESQLE